MAKSPSMEATMTSRGNTKAHTPTEHTEQKALAEWWGLYARWKSLPASLLMAIPNGGAPFSNHWCAA